VNGSTAYITHPRYQEHDLGEHPEHAGRIRAVWQRMYEGGLLDRLVVREAVEATGAQIAAVHTEDYLQTLERVSEQSRIMRIDADTYALPVSYEIARLSAGAQTLGVDLIFTDEVTRAVCATRPPGHHAIAGRGMGFCLLANVAIAARHAQHAYGVERVLIVDFDVHHGNGTEAIFYDDPSVLFVSTHQAPLYPGTGALEDTGTGAGAGTTLNLPVPANTGDAGLLALFDEVIAPAVERYRPGFIIASAGFDAHWLDPLAGLRVTSTGFAHIAQRLNAMADRSCGGRILYGMEGGYNVDALSYGMSNIARVCLGDAPIDPLGAPPPRPEPDLTGLIAKARRIHGL
jgi:acetoin utilization deacetylase AcuC-like enzyme